MNEKFKMDKVSKTIILLLIIYAIAAIAIFMPGYLSRRGKLYIITNSVKIKYDNGKWSNIINVSDYRLKKFDVYDDTGYLGNYKLMYGKKISLYDGDKKVNYSGSVLAYRGTLSLENYSVEGNYKITEEDKVVFNEVYNKLNLPVTYDLSYVQKAEVNNTYIYAITNYDVDDSNKRFSIIFSYKDNEVDIIDKTITTDEKKDDGKLFSILNVLDIRKDGKYELLYSSNYPNASKDSECVILYNLNKNKKIHNFCK